MAQIALGAPEQGRTHGINAGTINDSKLSNVTNPGENQLIVHPPQSQVTEMPHAATAMAILTQT